MPQKQPVLNAKTVIFHRVLFRNHKRVF